MDNETKLYQCPAYLFCMYELLDKNSKQIAKECGVAPSTILRWLRKFNIKITTNGKFQKGKMSGENHPMYGRTGEKAPMYGRTGENCPAYGIRGENHPKWKEDASYESKHMWIRIHFPPKEICDNKCEICGKFNLNLNLAQFRHINVRNMENPMVDYLYICPYIEKNSCHRVYDKLTDKQKKELLNGAITREEKLERVKYIMKIKQKNQGGNLKKWLKL